MAGLISIGGLVTGLDTNKMIESLVALERRPLDQLGKEISATNVTKSALATLQAKFLTFKTAADGLKTVGGVLVRKSSSSNESVLSAAAGAGAERGTATITTSQLARASVAGSTVGKTAASDTVAAGAGTFRFQVGSGDVQTVDIDATTTLQDLANAINDTDAGVTASAINAGTAASPDYRLQLQSRTTGESSTITIVQDDTQLAIQTSQTGLNAQFTVSGFSTAFERESNTFNDVLTGVTISLRSEGTSTVTVDDDVDAIVDKVTALAAAFNDIKTFVADESKIENAQGKDELITGPLAGNSTVRQLLERLQSTFSEAISGAEGSYVNLSSLGLATQKDGSVLFTEATLRSAIADDPNGVAAVFAGNDDSNGVAADLATLLADVTGSTGAFASQNTSLDARVRDMQDQIDQGTRNVDAYEDSLRLQFANLESLVASLQTQGNFLQSALGG
ncbi:MAG TPA: flagellar filament capping protein FliD [Candidatus Binatia bacterium]|jgi:flagellar hook-associated protein 2|nr:flagellar filament capping protein FliD [Candidatus Binatia bacterium]